MLSCDFSFWLHGWSEINGGAAPSDQQWQIILDHLALVNRTSAADAARPASDAPSGTYRIGASGELVPMLPFTGVDGTVTLMSGISLSTYRSISVC